MVTMKVAMLQTVSDCGGTAVEDECGDCGGNGPTPGYDCDDNCISQNTVPGRYVGRNATGGRYTTLMVMWYCLATIHKLQTVCTVAI